VSQFHFDPSTYDTLIRAEVPAYEELEDRVAHATAGVEAARILDLGAGTGETARRVRALHPAAAIVALDVSEAMLERIDLDAVESVAQPLQAPLPSGPFDLVVSALAVHHLDGSEKRDLFARVRDVLRPGGRFVLGDVVVAEREVAPLSVGYDKPDRAADQLDWLRSAGFDARIDWEHDDLALIVADLPSTPPGFGFAADVRVRFAETDAQGIAHNSNYFVWFEVARVEHLERYAGGYQRLRDLGIEALVLETHVRYLQPARFDDRLRIHARCVDIKGARFRYEYAVERNGEVIADGWTAHATVDAASFRPTRVPSWLIQALSSSSSLWSSSS